MDIFDIVGPIMVGPSSSHTAGAVRIGYIGGKLLGEPVKKAQILLYGSLQVCLVWSRMITVFPTASI